MQGVQGAAGLPAVPFLPNALQAFDLAAFDLGVDAQNLDRLHVGPGKLVDADNDLLSALQLLLVAVTGVGDLSLRIPKFNGSHHAAQVVDLPDVCLRLGLHTVGQGLHEI